MPGAWVVEADHASSRLFATWFTSTADGRDHAVTDEEFAENRSAPTAVCGAVVVWGPMELPLGQRCGSCLGALRAAGAAAAVLSRQVVEVAEPGPSSLRSVFTRLRRAIINQPFGWIPSDPPGVTVGPCKLSQASSTTAVALAGDRPEPPAAAAWSRLTAADGVPAGEGAALLTPAVASPALFVSATVSVTGARPAAAQPSLPTDPGAVCAGLGGSQLPAADLSSAPDGRDGQQDGHLPARPRRVVLLTTKPFELPSPAWFGPIHPDLPAAALTVPAPR